MRWANMVSYSLHGMVFLVQLVKDNFLCVSVVICNTLAFIGFHVSKSKMKPLITSKWNTRVSCCFKEHGQLNTSVDCWWENGDVKARGAKSLRDFLGFHPGEERLTIEQNPALVMCPHHFASKLCALETVQIFWTPQHQGCLSLFLSAYARSLSNFLTLRLSCLLTATDRSPLWKKRFNWTI